MTGPRNLLYLLFFFLLAGACSSQEPPPVRNSSSGGAAGQADGLGGSGAGGSSGASGVGGEEVSGAINGVCAPGDPNACVSTCSLRVPSREPNTCVGGIPTCPDGFVLFSSCPEDSCVEYLSCCDETTGGFAEPSCGNDGFLVCPAGSHLADGECIPPSLGVSDCKTLATQPCSQPEQRCTSDNYECDCGVHAQGDAGLSWGCLPEPLIP